MIDPVVHSAPVRLARHFVCDERGATAIEYAMIAAGIGATIAATVWGLGADVKSTLYDKLSQLFS